jgi:hypothetical protein
VALCKYRLTHSTLALFEEPGGAVAKPLPENALVTFDPADLGITENVMVTVIWETSTVKMFAADLRTLAVPAR